MPSRGMSSRAGDIAKGACLTGGPEFKPPWWHGPYSYNWGGGVERIMSSRSSLATQRVTGKPGLQERHCANQSKASSKDFPPANCVSLRGFFLL